MSETKEEEAVKVQNLLRGKHEQRKYHLSSQAERVRKTTARKNEILDIPESVRSGEVSCILFEINTQQCTQVMKAANAMAWYSQSDRRIKELVDILVRTDKLSVNCIIGSSFIPTKVLYRSRQKKLQGSKAMGEVAESSQGYVYLSQGNDQSPVLHVPTGFDVLM